MIKFKRFCIDKVFFSIFDRDYAQKKHRFDKKVAENFSKNLRLVNLNARSRFKRNVSEHVLRFRSKKVGGSVDLRLRGTRAFMCRKNIIKLLKDELDLETVSSEIMHDTNFFSIETADTIPFEMHIARLRALMRELGGFYQKTAGELWGAVCSKLDYSILQIEVPFELYPVSVSDIAYILENMSDIAHVRYATGTKTIYINSVEKKAKYQIKIYQKAPALARIEFTFFKELGNAFFNFRARTDEEISQSVQNWVHVTLAQLGLDSETLEKMNYTSNLKWFEEIVDLLDWKGKIGYGGFTKLAENQFFRARELNFTNNEMRFMKKRKWIYKTKYGNYGVNPALFTVLNSLQDVFSQKEVFDLREKNEKDLESFLDAL